MRALFYISDRHWTARARVFVAAARGLMARGHQSSIVCTSGAPIVEHIAGNGVETVLLDGGANVASTGWELRRTLQERFVEVAFVHTEREQLVLSSAMRLAERGAVIRRVPPLAGPVPAHDGIARRLASAGLLLSTPDEAAMPAATGWAIPAAVAPIGVDAASYDAVQPALRSALGIPATALVIGCPYADNGRPLLANVMRTMALLGSRRADLHVVVLGRDALDESLRMHTSAVGVSSTFSFLGETPDPRAVLRACDLVWVAAEGDEGAFGLLDAMALRLPVIIERTPLAQHYANDEASAWVLPDGEIEQFASSVASVLASPDRRAAIGQAARARVQGQFTEAAMIDGFERAGAAAGDRTRWAVR